MEQTEANWSGLVGDGVSYRNTRLSPEAVEAARAIGRRAKFSSEAKQRIAEIMTPLLEQWAAEGYAKPGRRGS